MVAEVARRIYTNFIGKVAEVFWSKILRDLEVATLACLLINCSMNFCRNFSTACPIAESAINCQNLCENPWKSTLLPPLCGEEAISQKNISSLERIYAHDRGISFVAYSTWVVLFILDFGLPEWSRLKLNLQLLDNQGCTVLSGSQLQGADCLEGLKYAKN